MVVLTEQLQYALRFGIGLGQHGSSCLEHDLSLGKCHHFLGEVKVTDAGLGCRQVPEATPILARSLDTHTNLWVNIIFLNIFNFHCKSLQFIIIKYII